MKRFITYLSALAAAAGAAYAASVESANTVGYQEFEPTGVFNFSASTFVPVGTDGSTAKLGDIKGAGAFTPGRDTIKVYDNGGFLLADYTYYPEGDPEGYGLDAGWYELENFMSEDGPYVLKNDVAIPYSSGFVFNRASIGAKLVYVGEVKLSDVTLPSFGLFNLSGNVFPVRITLGNIKGAGAFTPGRDTIKVYDNGGFLLADYTYYPEGDPAGYGLDAGWYELENFMSEDGPYVLKNDVAVNPAQGFVFNKTIRGALLVASPPTF